MFPFLLSWAAQLSNKLILAWCHPFLFILSRNKQNKKKLESNMTSSRKIDFNIFRVFSAQISNGNSRDFPWRISVQGRKFTDKTKLALAYKNLLSLTLKTEHNLPKFTCIIPHCSVFHTLLSPEWEVVPINIVRLFQSFANRDHVLR